MSFSYSDSPNFDNISHLISDFFQTIFVDQVPKLYMLHCFLCNKATVLEFFYKTISIAYSLSNTYEYNYIKIPGITSWLDITKLLFYLDSTIVVFVTHYSCL